MAYVQLLAFFIASSISLGVIYYKLPLSFIQQIIIFIIIFLIFTSKKFLGSGGNITKNFKFLLLLLTSLSIQLLVLSTGAIFSPFLILLHLYTLATSFLLSIQASVGFLILSVSILGATIWLDPKLQKLFLDDPGSAILYFTSFVVIIPLAYLFMRTYHLKEVLSNRLADLVGMSVKKEGLILAGLEDNIIVLTDQNLKIISSSEALNKLLNKSSEEITNQNLLDTIKLTDSQNNPPSPDSLSINQVIRDKVTHIVKGFNLTENLIPRPMSIQISPIANQEGKVTQIAFIFSEEVDQKTHPHLDLEEARKQNKILFEVMKQLMLKTNQFSLTSDAILYQNHEDDLNLAQEIEDHQIKLAPRVSEIAYLTNKAALEEKDLARIFNLRLEFKFPDKDKDYESIYFEFIESDIDPINIPFTNYSILIDQNYCSILLQKMIDLAIFLADAKFNPLINISLEADDQLITVNIQATNPNLDETELQNLFIPYYGNKLGHTNIKFSSGLEGYIAKTIYDQLGINFNHNYNKASGILNLSLQITKKLAG